MGNKVITGTVNADGSMTMDYNGYEGKRCVTEHEKLLEELNKLGVQADFKATDSKPKHSVGQLNRQREAER